MASRKWFPPTASRNLHERPLKHPKKSKHGVSGSQPHFDILVWDVRTRAPGAPCAFKTVVPGDISTYNPRKLTIHPTHPFQINWQCSLVTWSYCLLQNPIPASVPFQLAVDHSSLALYTCTCMCIRMRYMCLPTINDIMIWYALIWYGIIVWYIRLLSINICVCVRIYTYMM